MCGRFSLITVSQFLSERFNVKIDEEISPRYNISPGQDVWIITEAKPIKAYWGMTPSWAKDRGMKLINARAETLLEKPAFKASFRTKRCLIPADGFYEWKKADGQKIPYRITQKDGELFAFAGLYDIWQHEDETILSCAIITTSPNKLVAEIHDRMPAILRREHEKAWLTEMRLEWLKEHALRPYSSEEMKAYRVSELVNSPLNNSEEVIRPLKSLADF